jgi:MFS family permease
MRKYGVLLTRGGIGSWSILRLITRFPAAAAPIMFVMLSRTELGQYTVGSWMAAACVFSECLAAPVLGARADRKPVAPDARVSLAVATAALITLAVGVTALPHLVLVILAGIMGGSIAGLIGSLRVLLTRLLDPESVHVGLSWDSVITGLTFAVSPLLVTSLALTINGRVPLLVAAAGNVFALLWLSRVPGISSAPAVTDALQPQTERPWSILARAWPIYLTSGAAMFLSGAIETSASPLVEAGGHDIRWAGIALSGFSVASVAGGLAYGLRAWPGGYRAQCLVLLISTSAFVALSAISGSRFGIVGVLLPLAAAGFTQACLVTARNLSLHESLPTRYLSTGNSVLYSASCVGFGLSSAFAGWYADRGAVIAFLVVSCGIAVALALGSALVETQRSSIARHGQASP